MFVCLFVLAVGTEFDIDPCFISLFAMIEVPDVS